ncbi:MAG TPA: glycosyltransferase family 1 protein [Patescibacteria group bacterium]|jgi:glycosyltransferase involved in cell wall biosynthesis
MRIGVDARPFASPTGRGVGHYAEQLVGELIARYPEDTWVLLQTGRRAWRPGSPLRKRNVEVRHVRVPNKLMNASLAMAGRPSLRRLLGPVDAFFMPNLGFLPRLGKTPLVLTVHDLSFERSPELYTRKERLWHAGVRPRRLVGAAGRVITVSVESRRELVRWYGVPSAKVSAVHPGIDPALRSPTAAERRRVRRKYGLPGEYFLYVGAYEPRKNLPRLLDGYQSAKKRGLKADLIMVGPEPPAPWRRRFDVARAAGAKVLGYVPAGDKPGLYGEALATALVSRQEGFGFPPLESLACGTPGLVSPLRIFDETVGPGALRVGSAAAVARELLRLERSPALRRRLAAKGKSRLGRFRWSRAAAGTYRLIKEAAQES